MPTSVDGSRLAVHGFENKKSFRFLRGFSLLEILVVMTIFVLTSTLVISGYLTFERNQRLKNAALALKGDIRLVQNKALTGDKAGVGLCASTTTLVGWFIKFRTGAPQNTGYTFSGAYLCGSNYVEVGFGPKTINLPKDVTITNIAYGSNVSEANVLYRPLSEVVTFHSTMPIPNPNFLDDSTGSLRAQLIGGTELVITLSGLNVSGHYEVRIRSTTGEVYEQFVP